MLFTWHGAHACCVLLSMALVTLYDLHMQQCSYVSTQLRYLTCTCCAWFNLEWWLMLNGRVQMVFGYMACTWLHDVGIYGVHMAAWCLDIWHAHGCMMFGYVPCTWLHDVWNLSLAWLFDLHMLCMLQIYVTKHAVLPCTLSERIRHCMHTPLSCLLICTANTLLLLWANSVEYPTTHQRVM